MRLLVTRPQPQADAWVARLRGLGVEAHALPLLRIEPPADGAALRAAALQIAQFDLLMFVSPNAVDAFFAQPKPSWPPTTLAAATGPGTVAALRAAGVPAQCIVAPADDAQQFDSEALWPVLAAARNWQGTQALIVCGDGGRDWLGTQLRAAGAQVRQLAAYRRLPPTPSRIEAALLAEAVAAPQRHVWLFSSSQALGQLAALAPGVGFEAWQALATHPRIAQAARDAGFGRVAAVAARPEAVAAALTRSIQSPRP